MVVPQVSAEPISQPSATPKTPPKSPIAPASAKKRLRTSRSVAPSAFNMPISRRRSGMAREEGLHVVRLSDMELLCGLQRKVYSRATEPADPCRRIRLGDANNAQGLFARNYGDAAGFAGAHHGIEKGFIVGVLRERGA